MKQRAALFLIALALVGAFGLEHAAPSRADEGEEKPLRWERVPIDIDLKNVAGLAESDADRIRRRLSLWRAKVPGGWLLMGPDRGVAFYPDADHTWGGGSLPR